MMKMTAATTTTPPIVEPAMSATVAGPSAADAAVGMSMTSIGTMVVVVVVVVMVVVVVLIDASGLFRGVSLLLV